MEENRKATGIMEFDSVPTGYRIVNDVLKNNKITFFEDRLIARNKYVALLQDSYTNVEAAISHAVSFENNHIVDFAMIGNTHSELQQHIDAAVKEGRFFAAPDPGVDIAVIETETFSECVEKANSILHYADVSLIGIDCSDSLNGKCLITLQGNTSNLMASIERLGTGELILKPDKRLLQSIFGRGGWNR